MAASTINNGSVISALNQPSAASTQQKKKNDQIGQNEFLQLLITQLKNQDPMNPQDSNQFAVDMSQFAQVEQLIQANQKLDKLGASGGDTSSLVSYLGKEVSISSDMINVEGSSAGRVRVNLPGDAASVKIELLNTDGSVAESIDAGALSKGKHSVALENVHTTEGAYKYRVRAFTAAGGEITADAKVSGIVSGFVPGADPKLMMGSREISPADIVEINLADS